MAEKDSDTFKVDGRDYKPHGAAVMLFSIQLDIPLYGSHTEMRSWLEGRQRGLLEAMPEQMLRDMLIAIDGLNEAVEQQLRQRAGKSGC